MAASASTPRESEREQRMLQAKLETYGAALLTARENDDARDGENDDQHATDLVNEFVDKQLGLRRRRTVVVDADPQSEPERPTAPAPSVTPPAVVVARRDASYFDSTPLTVAGMFAVSALAGMLLVMTILALSPASSRVTPPEIALTNVDDAFKPSVYMQEAIWARTFIKTKLDPIRPRVESDSEVGMLRDGFDDGVARLYTIKYRPTPLEMAVVMRELYMRGAGDIDYEFVSGMEDAFNAFCDRLNCKRYAYSTTGHEFVVGKSDDIVVL
jgi:hypothetical protein